MTQVDASIYSQLKPLDVGGAIQQGMNMRQMAMQNRVQSREIEESESIKEVFKKNVAPDPTTGAMTLNRASAIAEIGKINPMKALDFDTKFREQDFAKEKAKNEKFLQGTTMMGQLFGAAKDQTSYDLARNDVIRMGLMEPGNVPRAFDPKFVSSMQMKALTAKEQTEHKLKLQELDIKRMESARKAAAGETLPIDSKKFVESTSTDIAKRSGVKNMIDATTANWHNLTDDQKLASGRQLLKVLNSPLGADAIGAEEANRLGAKLEFAFGNFTNSNTTQFGRDLRGFFEQAKNTAQMIGTANESSQLEIDQRLGRRRAPVPKSSGLTGGAPQGGGSGPAAADPYDNMTDEEIDRAFKAAGGG